MMIEKRIIVLCLPLLRLRMYLCRLRLRSTGGQWNEGALISVWLCGPHSGIQRTERHHPSRRSIMEAAALDAAHINVALIHKRFDKQRQRLSAGPERGIGADMGPERFHQFETAANIGDELWQHSRAATREHAQRHIRAGAYDIHELFQGEVWSDGFITLSGIFKQGKA